MKTCFLRFVAAVLCAVPLLAVSVPTLAQPSTSAVKKAGVKPSKNSASARPTVKKRSVKKLKKPVAARSLKAQPVALKRSRMAAAPSVPEDSSAMPKLYSTAVAVWDEQRGSFAYSKNLNTQQPVASITKVMTAMVVLDAHQSLDEVLEISAEDVDTLKGSHSRLQVGTRLTRSEMLKLALMASENRAASALARSYPGGTAAAVMAMNHKAAQLGMRQSRFVDPTGLDARNVSTASDLVRMVDEAANYPQITEFSTSSNDSVQARSRTLHYVNTNALVREGQWQVSLSKTGYIREAGRCLVMRAQIDGRPMVMIFLDSNGKKTRVQDAVRLRHWLEAGAQATMRS